jgi:LysR family hydrogen peroxide-inducible transcriptional activator
MATQQEIRLVETSGFNEPLAFLNRFINSKWFYELQPSDKTNLLLHNRWICYNAQLLDICGLQKLLH